VPIKSTTSIVTNNIANNPHNHYTAESEQSSNYLATQSSARVIKQTQFNNDGLIILRALYGDIVEFGEPVPSTQYRPGKCVDISMHLQANVDSSSCSLIIHQNDGYPLFKRLKDIFNPNANIKSKLIRNRLAVTYYFQGEIHYAIFDDTDTVILPVESHQYSSMPDDGEYPDIIFTYQNYPEWLALLPTNDDETFEILGENWDETVKYQNVPRAFQANSRPEGVLCEPRFIVYERQKRVEERQSQKNLLLGVTAAGLITLGTLQLTGFINMATWPGLNLIFGSSESSVQQQQPQQQIQPQQQNQQLQPQ
jgi:hypothetical protein